MSYYFTPVRSPSFQPLMKKRNSVALVREGTILTERPPRVSKVNANFCG
jgi:hypothetical protein